jgi:hypothetical protein
MSGSGLSGIGGGGISRGVRRSPLQGLLEDPMFAHWDIVQQIAGRQRSLDERNGLLQNAMAEDMLRRKMNAINSLKGKNGNRTKDYTTNDTEQVAMVLGSPQKVNIHSKQTQDTDRSIDWARMAMGG